MVGGAVAVGAVRSEECQSLQRLLDLRVVRAVGVLDGGGRFIDALQMFYHVANIGDARSLAIHPATTTHSQLSPEEQLQTGVDENYVRLSIGIEHEEDILADLSQALEAA